MQNIMFYNDMEFFSFKPTDVIIYVHGGNGAIDLVKFCMVFLNHFHWIFCSFVLKFARVVAEMIYRY